MRGAEKMYHWTDIPLYSTRTNFKRIASWKHSHCWIEKEKNTQKTTKFWKLKKFVQILECMIFVDWIAIELNILHSIFGQVEN